MLTASAIKRKLFTQISKEQFQKIYTNIDYLGGGTQSDVKKAIKDGKKVAIKFFKRQYLGADVIKYIQSQIQTLNEIRHQNILQLIDSYKVVQSKYSQKYCIVLQFCQSNLAEYYHIEHLSVLQKLKICQQFVSAINVSHDHGIMHRDIKPENILIKELSSMIIKVADFGCSRTDQKEDLTKTEHIGTPLYAAPNLQTGNYSVKCDVYSLGLVIIYIFCGVHFFTDCYTRQELQQKQKRFFNNLQTEANLFLEKFNFSLQLRQFLIQVARFTLTQNEEQRFSSESLLQYIRRQIQTYEKERSIEMSQSIQDQNVEPSNTFKKNKKKVEEEPQITSNDDYTKIQSKLENKLTPKKSEKSYISPIKQTTKKQQYYSLQQNQQIKNNNSLNQTYIKSQKSNPSLKSYKDISTQFSNNEQSNNQSRGDTSLDFQTPLQQFQKPSSKLHQNPLNRSLLQKSNFPQQMRDFQISKSKKRSADQNLKLHTIYEPEKINQIREQNQISSLSGSFSKTKQMFGNLKTSSQILNQKSNIDSSKKIMQKSRKLIVDQSKIKKLKQQQERRKKNMSQYQKKLTDSQKLTGQMIRYEYQISNKYQEIQIFKRILNSFVRTNKIYFQTVLEVNKLKDHSLKDQYRECIAFLFHYLYAKKLQDVLRFISGKQSSLASNLNVQSRKISQEMKKTLSEIVDKQIKKIYPEIVRYSEDLGRKIGLLRETITEVISTAINDIRLSEHTLQIRFSQSTIKAEAKKYIEARLQKVRTNQDVQILRNLLRSLTKIV